MPATPMDIQAYARKTYLRPSQRQELKESLARNKAALEGRLPNGLPLPSVTGLPPTDAAALRETINREESMLAMGTPPVLTPLESRQRYLWMKNDLEPEIKNGMPSYEMMEKPHPTNIDAHMAWEKHRLDQIRAWKGVRRELDPENEEVNFTNVEILRSATPPTIDLRQYWKNYDLITWADAREIEEIPLDDESFGRFTLLKAGDMAPALIQRELNWTKEVYEQAMQRLRQAMMREAPTGDVEPEPPEDVDPPQTSLVPPDDPKAFGAWAKWQIDARHLIKARVADAIGIPANYLSNYLRGSAHFPEEPRENLLNWLRAFDADPSAYASCVHEEMSPVS
jgi:hypothetical protein